MNTVMSFCVGLVFTLAASMAVVFYMNKSLKNILADLCGTEQRADFWTAFSNVVLVLFPMIFALTQRPEGGSLTMTFFEIADQLLWALAGLLVAVLILGFFISIFIVKDIRQKSTEPHKVPLSPIS